MYLRGVSDMIRAVDDPDRFGRRWVNNLAGTAIPTGLAQIARLQDPTFRDARSIIDKLKSRIPGQRETLQPRLDPFGEPIVAQGSVGPDILSRAFKSKIGNDPAIKELLRLDVIPRRPKRKLGGVDLTPEQVNRFTELSRKPFKQTIDRLVANPGYQELPDAAKEKLLRGILRKSGEDARDLLRLTTPSLNKKIIEEKIKELQ